MPGAQAADRPGGRQLLAPWGRVRGAETVGVTTAGGPGSPQAGKPHDRDLGRKSPPSTSLGRGYARAGTLLGTQTGNALVAA